MADLDDLGAEFEHIVQHPGVANDMPTNLVSGIATDMLNQYSFGSTLIYNSFISTQRFKCNKVLLKSNFLALKSLEQNR